MTVAEIQRSRSSLPVVYGTSQILVLAQGSQDKQVLPRGAAAGGARVPRSPLSLQSPQDAPSSLFRR